MIIDTVNENKYYDVNYAELVYKLLQIISIFTTLGFIILLLIKDNVFMHFIVYFDDAIISRFIFGLLIEHIYIPDKLYYLYSKPDLFGWSYIYLPLYPLSNLYGFIFSFYVNWDDMYFLFLLFSMTIAIINLIIFMILWWLTVKMMIVLLRRCRIINKSWDNLIQFTRLLLQFLTWYHFIIYSFIPILIFQLIVIIEHPREFFYFLYDDIFDYGILFCILIIAIIGIIVYWGILWVIPCWIYGLIKGFMKQIILGKSSSKGFVLQFVDDTKPKIKCKLFYLFWIIKKNIETFILFSLLMFGMDSLEMMYFSMITNILIFISWLVVILNTMPFRNTSLNFAIIINQLASVFMLILILCKIKVDILRWNWN